MRSFLPIPPPFLSVTACVLIGSSVAQRLAALSSLVVQACVGAHRQHASAHFSASAPSFALVRSCFSVCASLLVLVRGYVSRCLSLGRLGQWAWYAPFSVGLQQSRFGNRSINPSSPGSANPAVNRTPKKQGAFCSTHLARRRLLPR
jgi:hypothetical protein